MSLGVELAGPDLVEGEAAMDDVGLLLFLRPSSSKSSSRSGETSLGAGRADLFLSLLNGKAGGLDWTADAKDPGEIGAKPPPSASF